MITKEDVKRSINNKKIIFIKHAVEKTPTWQDFKEIFNEAIKSNKINYQSFASIGIDNSEAYSPCMNELINFTSQLHPGKKIAVMSILHMLNATNNTVPKEAEEFSKLFFSSNPTEVPPEFDFKLLVPARHSDPVDGFYIQCNGTTIWRAFYESGTEEFDVEPGDMLFIPKGIDHSVESTSVRNAVSISFTDH